MPTPFTHLRYAERALTDPALPDSARAALEAGLPEYLLGSVVADAQAVAKADLVPKKEGNPCTGVLRWWICNIGTKTAAASTATVQFDENQPIGRSIPMLAPGQCSVKNTTLLPPQSDGEVVWRVTADATNKVAESNENNNVIGGLCVE